MNKLADAPAFFGHVASIATEGRDQLKTRANSLFNRFKDYKIATVTARRYVITRFALDSADDAVTFAMLVGV